MICFLTTGENISDADKADHRGIDKAQYGGGSNVFACPSDDTVPTYGSEDRMVLSYSPHALLEDGPTTRIMRPNGRGIIGTWTRGRNDTSPISAKVTDISSPSDSIAFFEFKGQGRMRGRNSKSVLIFAGWRGLKDNSEQMLLHEPLVKSNYAFVDNSVQSLSFLATRVMSGGGMADDSSTVGSMWDCYK
jgi:hypothetical protein